MTEWIKLTLLPARVGRALHLPVGAFAFSQHVDTRSGRAPGCVVYAAGHQFYVDETEEEIKQMLGIR